MTPIEVVKKRILDRVPLATLIGDSITLQSRSGRKVGLCPFHAEKSPSFTIYDSHYFCFGCRAHGDAIDFVRHQQGIGFIEALRYLAHKYSIEAAELDDSDRHSRQRQAMASLYRALNGAQEFFVTQLNHPSSNQFRDYLRQRGFSDDNIKDFGFGYAPGDNNPLMALLRRQSFSVADLETASLLTRSQDGQRYYDFFRDRLTIPIRDPQGRLIAFGGRTTVDHPAKYLNSRDNPLFDKSNTLFGLDRAKSHIRQNGFAIIVEGYMDTLMLWQCGITNAVACLGTALTPLHLRQLAQITSRVVLLFDGDAAGQKASLRSVDTSLTQPQMQLQVAVLPNQEDPDVFVQRAGADALRALVDKAPDLLDFALRQKLHGIRGLAVTDLISSEFIPWLKQLRDPIQRGFLINRIAHLTGVSSKDLEAGVAAQTTESARAAASVKQHPGENAATIGKAAAALSQVEYELLAHLYYAKPGELVTEDVRKLIRCDLELDDRWSRVAEYMLQQIEHNHSPAESELTPLHQHADQEIEKFLDRVRAAAAAFTCSDRRHRLDKLAIRQRETRLREALADLKSRLRQAAAAGAPDAANDVPELLKAIKSINSDLNSLQRS